MLRLSSRHAKPLDHRRRVSGRPQPRAGQKLPYLLRVPIEGGMVLKAREAWPVLEPSFCRPGYSLGTAAQVT
jgi:hypothetical protein